MAKMSDRSFLEQETSFSPQGIVMTWSNCRKKSTVLFLHLALPCLCKAWLIVREPIILFGVVIWKKEAQLLCHFSWICFKQHTGSTANIQCILLLQWRWGHNISRFS